METQAQVKNTWNTTELQEEFRVLSFSAPYVRVKRRSDGQEGVMEFTHSPRVYFDFVPDNY